jgi:hypothetical protein
MLRFALHDINALTYVTYFSYMTLLGISEQPRALLLIPEG